MDDIAELGSALKADSHIYRICKEQNGTVEALPNKLLQSIAWLIFKDSSMT